MGLHLNLELVLVGLTFITGFVLLFYRFKGKTYDENNQEPLLLDYSRSFFPILLIVVLLRSFVAEPFRIPSGSMIPTLEIGDFILVKKYAYGVKLPIVHNKIFETGEPQRGDVVVFRYPPNPKINFIKRLIGLPGDHIKWTQDKKLFISGEAVKYQPDGKYLNETNSNKVISVSKLRETLPGGSPHNLILFPGFSKPGEWKVPKGHYFMMGDNRDNSSDSRFWGFVPEKNLVGKASLVWMHWDWSDGGSGFNASRIGTSVD